MLRYDPIAALLATDDAALTWAVRHDLLDERLQPEPLWKVPEVLAALRSQNADGSWPYHGGRERLRSWEDYGQLATFKQLLVLVSIYRLNRSHAAIKAAAESLLGHQKPAGDIRGIYGSQYTPNYTADILRLLIEAGYVNDDRIVRGIEWLLASRQRDGGWAIPLRTAGRATTLRAIAHPQPIEPDRSRPSSHFVTGIVLRALAAHPSYRHHAESTQAATLLAARFFRSDGYTDRKDASYWTKLAFPFRWTDLVSALDSIALIGLKPDQPDVARGLRWLLENQRPNGLWRCGYPKSPDPHSDQWVTFAAARVIKRFFGKWALDVSRTPVAARRSSSA